MLQKTPTNKEILTIDHKQDQFNKYDALIFLTLVTKLIYSSQENKTGP